MTRFDQDSADCLVYTFKEGLLSKLAHDLEIRVGQFEIHIDEETPSVRATFDAGSLEVVTAVRGGKPDPTALSTDDKQKIRKNILGDVLHTRRFPQIRFESSKVTEAPGGGFSVDGELTLHGVARRVQIPVRVEGDSRVAEVELHQPDFRIRPFRAALGALRIQPGVRVKLTLPSS